MIKRVFFLSVFLSFMFGASVFAKSEFAKLNPDGKKYEFGRSYITALSYLKNIDTRWDKNEPKKRFAGSEHDMIRANIDYLVKDNADLRITKNYLIKYIASSNALMRKAADVVVVACDRIIDINNKEKELWSAWLITKTTGHANREKELIFLRQQQDFSFKRKEVNKKIIEASILTANVLKSEDNDNEKGNKLAITRTQRQRLLQKLDSFAKKDIDWGLKPGQRTISASIAVIREVLEDPLWISVNDS